MTLRLIVMLGLSALSAAAQYCAPAMELVEIFGKGLTVCGPVTAVPSQERELLYTIADGSPEFSPMDQACGTRTVNAASGCIPCGQLEPNTTYYIHPSFDGSTHDGCQTATAAFSCGAVGGFPGTAGEAACEVETDADGTNEVIKIRTPDDGAAPEAPDPPVFTRAWDAGYTESPTSSATVATSTVDSESVATDFLAKVAAAVDLLKANPSNTYRVFIPASTKVRPENDGTTAAPKKNFDIPACNGGETGYIIIESETPDPDAMPPYGATPTRNEDWAAIEFNRNGPLMEADEPLLDFASPACPVILHGVTVEPAPHALKERWQETGTATVTPGGTHTSDSVLLTFDSGELTDVFTTTYMSTGITVAGLKGDLWHNGTNENDDYTGSTAWTRTGDTITIPNNAAIGTAGAAVIHNIISLPFTSAAGALLATPTHPYLDSPQTAITDIASGTVTTAAVHGISGSGRGNPVWVQGTEECAGGSLDGFYRNASTVDEANDRGRDTSTLDLIDNANAAIGDCTPVGGTVQIIGVALVVSDSYPHGISCFVSFPSSTSVRIEQCTADSGLSRFVPDLTGETGFISYDPPVIPPLIRHRGGPLSLVNVNIGAPRPWRTEEIILSEGAGLYLTGVNVKAEMWLPVAPNPYAGGAVAMTRNSSYKLTHLVRCAGCSELIVGPGRFESGGWAIFGKEQEDWDAPHDILKRQLVHVFPDHSMGGLSGVLEHIRQPGDEYKSGVNRLHWIGNTFIGAGEHNVPAAATLYCKVNGVGYGYATERYFSCRNILIEKNFFSAPRGFSLADYELGNNPADEYRWLVHRKIAINDNIFRMRARKSPIDNDFMTGALYTSSGFHTTMLALREMVDVDVSGNLFLPTLGDANGNNGAALNRYLELGDGLGGGFRFEHNLVIDPIINNGSYNRFSGSWAASVEAKLLSNGGASGLVDIANNAVAYCQLGTADPDYTETEADACTQGATYWNETGYATAFSRATCNAVESCKTRAEILINTGTLESQAAYSAYGPRPSIAGVLDAMGVIRDVTAERSLDGTAATIAYHAPDAAMACKTIYALTSVDMDRDSSGVEAAWDSTGTQAREVEIEGLTPGESYQIRIRCRYQDGLARGVI